MHKHAGIQVTWHNFVMVVTRSVGHRGVLGNQSLEQIFKEI